jgi:hypothetical protein
MIKTLLQLKYNVKEGLELIENSLVTDVWIIYINIEISELIRNILERCQNFWDDISFTKISNGTLFWIVLYSAKNQICMFNIIEMKLFYKIFSYISVETRL